jgi:hypothetical protein
MKSRRSWTWTLTAAGLLQISVAIAHFGLPTMFDWSSSVGDSLPPLLRWALFLFNFSWSTIVLGIGALTIYAAKLSSNAPLARAMILMLALFWSAHASYVVFEPMPLPVRLAWVQAPVVAFPVTLIALLAVALLTTKRSDEFAATVAS